MSDTTPMQICQKIQIEIKVSDDTVKKLFAAAVLQKLMDAKCSLPQYMNHYVEIAVNASEALIKARKEEAK